MTKLEKLCSICDEQPNIEQLRSLLESKPNFTAYNGFEPSGRMHIAQALMTAINSNIITSCGGSMTILIADYFAFLNHKMGGDMDKIREVGKYFIEVFTHCGFMDMTNVKFIWASEFIASDPMKYWNMVMDISNFASLARIKRCCTIMGRAEDDKSLSASQILYPCMQAADVLSIEGGVDIAQLGLDQRKVNMLAIEYAQSKHLKKPIILSHHMLMGLKGKNCKMSKSDPNSAIFVDDSEEDVARKIRKAYCPQTASDNPIIEYIQYLILPLQSHIVVKNVDYTNIETLCSDYEAHKFEPIDLKNGLTNALNQILTPVRTYFSSGEPKELLDKIKIWRK